MKETFLATAAWLHLMATVLWIGGSADSTYPMALTEISSIPKSFQSGEPFPWSRIQELFENPAAEAALPPRRVRAGAWDSC